MIAKGKETSGPSGTEDSRGLESRPQNLSRGVTLIVIAALAISIQDVVFKLFSTQMTLWQIFALRGLIAVPVLFAVLTWRRPHRGALRAALGKWPLLRSLFISISLLSFYAAIPFLSLSTVGAANYVTPIFVALLSAIAIREPVGVLGWMGVCLGFLGVVILLQPGSDAFSPWAILPVLGAASYALAHIVTRTKCESVSAPVLSLSLNVVLMMAGLAVSLFIYVLQPEGGIADKFPYIFGGWAGIGLAEALVLALLAAFAIVNGMLVAGAYKAAPPAIVSTFEYSYLLFVALWDILFFGTAPSLTSTIGMLLIVAAGVLVLRSKSG